LAAIRPFLPPGFAFFRTSPISLNYEMLALRRQRLALLPSLRLKRRYPDRRVPQLYRVINSKLSRPLEGLLQIVAMQIVNGENGDAVWCQNVCPVLSHFRTNRASPCQFPRASARLYEMPLLRRHRLGLREPSRPAVGRPARLPMRWRRDALPEVQSIQPG
jgi:hypothetical protein